MSKRNNKPSGEDNISRDGRTSATGKMMNKPFVFSKGRKKSSGTNSSGPRKEKSK